MHNEGGKKGIKRQRKREQNIQRENVRIIKMLVLHASIFWGSHYLPRLLLCWVTLTLHVSWEGQRFVSGGVGA